MYIRIVIYSLFGGGERGTVLVCSILMISGCENGHTAKVQEDNTEHAEAAIPETETAYFSLEDEPSDIPNSICKFRSVQIYIQTCIGKK